MKKSRLSEEQIIGILKQGASGVKTAELCREHGISAATFSQWKQKFGGLDVSEAQRLKALENDTSLGSGRGAVGAGAADR
jgi:putative transposase